MYMYVWINSVEIYLKATMTLCVSSMTQHASNTNAANHFCSNSHNLKLLRKAGWLAGWQLEELYFLLYLHSIQHKAINNCKASLLTNLLTANNLLPNKNHCIQN